jgi:hypothetical protein
MAEQPQIIVQQPVPPNKKFGARNQTNLQKIFPNSPIHSGELSDQERKEFYEKNVINGTVVGGHGINSFNLDYVDAPNFEDVQTGGGGLPATPFTPNLTSPGPGSMNAADQPVYEGTIIGNTELSSAEFGVGLGGTVSPSVTAKEISKQSVLGTYIMGRSFATSNG